MTKENKLLEAGPLLERALSIMETAHGKVHEAVAAALGSLGQNEVYSGNFIAAEQHYDRALAVFRQVYQTDHNPNVASMLLRLAELRARKKEYRAAELSARQSLAIFLELQGPSGVKTAMAHVQLGRILLCEKRGAEARQESQLGYDILLKQPPPQGSFFAMAKADLSAEDKAH